MTDDAPQLAPSLDRALAAALLALLRGQAPPDVLATLGPNSARGVRDLEERAAAGEEQARQVLQARAAIDALPARVERALGLERAPVILADGSSLSLDDAERLLARKEERRAHVPLRSSIDEALARFRQLLIGGIEGIEGIEGRATDDLKTFLVDTRGVRDAAREALATLGGEPPESAAALARALDLPDDQGAFGEARTLALLDGAREAARPDHRVTRVRAPRQLAGVCLTVETHSGLEARFAWPGLLLRFDRHRRTVDAGCRALTHDVVLAGAMSAGLLAPVPRRALAEERSGADRAGRVAAATLVLRMRALASLATLDEEALRGGGAREVLGDALGADPGKSAVEEALARSWTTIRDDLPGTARAALESVVAANKLRDAFDETFPLRADAWRAGLEPASATEAKEKARRWTAGLLEWAGPLL